MAGALVDGLDRPDGRRQAASMAAGVADATMNTTIVLVTPEEMDEVSKNNTQAYVPPRG